MKLSVLLYLVLNFLVTVVSAEDLILNKKNWLSTAQGNSLEADPSLFTFKNEISTSSEAINIHSHYKDKELSSLKNYTYSGQMKLADSGGGIGVTFHSRYPKADQYYRLRATPGSDFHIAPHPDGTQNITSGDTDSDIIPEPGVWYNFKINVRTSKTAVRIRAKVWKAGTRQPGWLIDCVDESDIRIKNGKPGIWSMASGNKSWKKLAVTVSQ